MILFLNAIKYQKKSYISCVTRNLNTSNIISTFGLFFYIVFRVKAVLRLLWIDLQQDFDPTINKCFRQQR